MRSNPAWASHDKDRTQSRATCSLLPCLCRCLLLIISFYCVHNLLSGSFGWCIHIFHAKLSALDDQEVHHHSHNLGLRVPGVLPWLSLCGFHTAEICFVLFSAQALPLHRTILEQGHCGDHGQDVCPRGWGGGTNTTNNNASMRTHLEFMLFFQKSSKEKLREHYREKEYLLLGITQNRIRCTIRQLYLYC